MANGNAEGESGVTREIKMVCVTGASGFIASWLVKLLLRRGYTVRGTVRDLSNPAKVEHLRSLEGANERLQLVEADLLKEGSFDEVVRGCECVFHTASPFFNNPKDPQADLLDPAVKGTLNVLTACKKASSVKRVVVTSSIAAARFNSRSLGPDSVIDETCFSDREYCLQNKFWYPLSKTLAEEAAWKFSKENNLDIVTINPVMVIGTLLQPSLNTSSAAILNLMSGSSTFPNSRLGWVSLKDVAEAHILAYEVPSANGRYVMCERVAHFSEIVRLLSTIYPGVPLPNKCADDNPYVPAYKVSRVRAEELGVKFTPTEEALRETVESLIEKKMLTLPSRH